MKIICTFGDYEVRTWRPEQDSLKFFNLIKDQGFQKFQTGQSILSLNECRKSLTKVKNRFF